MYQCVLPSDLLQLTWDGQCKIKVCYLSEDRFSLNSVDADEIPHYAEFHLGIHLGIHCLSKYACRSN